MLKEAKEKGEKREMLMREEMRERRKREAKNLKVKKKMEMREDVFRVEKKKEFGGSYSRMVSSGFAATY